MHQTVSHDFSFCQSKDRLTALYGYLGEGFRFSAIPLDKRSGGGHQLDFCHTEQNEVMGGMGSMYIAAALSRRHEDTGF